MKIFFISSYLGVADILHLLLIYIYTYIYIFKTSSFWGEERKDRDYFRLKLILNSWIETLRYESNAMLKKLSLLSTKMIYM